MYPTQVYNIYPSGIFLKVTSQKVNVADIGTIWRTEYNPKDLETKLQEDIDYVAEYRQNWILHIQEAKVFDKRI